MQLKGIEYDGHPIKKRMSIEIENLFWVNDQGGGN